MKTSGFDARRLVIASFTQAQATLEGRWPLAGLVRLGESTQPPADGSVGEVAWSVRGLWKQPVGRPAEMRIHLVAQATVHLTCQRCLQPMPLALDLDRTIRFVPGEDEAAQLDEELEEDVLALPRTLDLQSLVEDELILALPIVPMHETCPEPLSFSAEAATDSEAVEDERPNPFAALAALKSGR
jgi:uncharacterized protein